MTMSLLLVDDDDDFRNIFRLQLELAGFNVREAANGNEALNSLKQLPADLVVTDIVMPEMEGLELVRRIRSTYPETLVVAISGGGRADAKNYLQLAQNLGVNAVLAKPFSNSLLLSTLQGVMSQTL